MAKEICKNCEYARPTYKGIACELKKKKVKDKGVEVLVTDTHQDRKIAFGITDLIWITDEGPAIWINIDRNVNEDITADKEDEP